MSQSDPRSVVRIAIALAALKHRPRDQSIASYLLDLQSHFPVATKHDGSRDWRTYALELEKQLATLKAQRDADQELLSKITTDASQVASTSDAPPPKKKSKKNPSKDRHDPEWSWNQCRADWTRFLSSQYPPPPSLVAAYTSLKGALAAPDADLLSYASRLAGAILRALDAIRLFLFSPPNPGSDSEIQTVLGASPRLNPEHINSTRIALASPLLMYVLRTALHDLLRTAQDSTKSKRPRQRPRVTTLASADPYAHVDKVLDHLLECILLPLLRAITSLCFARLAPLVSLSLNWDKSKAGRPSGKGKNRGRDKGRDKDKDAVSVLTDHAEETDVCTDVFALIGTSLEALDALPPLICHLGPGVSVDRGKGESVAGGIRERLGLETIREIEALYAVPAPAPAPAPAPLSPGSLQPSSRQPPVTPVELQPPPPQLLTPSATPLSVASQSQPYSSSRSHPRSQSQPQPQSRTQRRAQTEARTSRLERLAGTRAERVRALATRDAGWFLVSALSLCLCAAPPSPAAPPRGLLAEVLLDRIGKLVRSVPLVGSDGQPNEPSGGRDVGQRSATGSKLAIDPVCQNMLLAICERAIGYFVSP